MGSTLQQQISALKQSLLDEDFVDEHFIELELLEDGDSSEFTEEIVALFFVDSAHLIDDVEKELNSDPIDYTKVDKILHQLKGSSSSVGASRVRLQGTKLRESCKDGDVEGWKVALKQLKEERETLKEKLDTYFQLVKQLIPEKRTAQHHNEEQVEILATEQLTKMAIFKDEEVDSVHKEDAVKKGTENEPEEEQQLTKDEEMDHGHKEDLVKKGTGDEPEKVVTEEEAVEAASDEPVQTVAE